MIKTRLSEFFAWWLAGLGYLLPEDVRLKMQPQHDRLLIYAGDQQFRLRYHHAGTSGQTREWTVRQNDEGDRAGNLRQLAGLANNKTRVLVVIPTEKVLIKPLTLPLSAQNNLREILGFEMDKQTPFDLEKVYFGWALPRLEPGTQKIQVELHVILKNYLDPILEEIRGWGLEPDRVCTGSGPAGNGVNLLPPEQRPVKIDPERKIIAGLAVLALALFMAVLYLPLLRQESALADLEAKVNKSRELAKDVIALEKEKENILARTRFLNEKRSGGVPGIVLLNELTRILPDNTWVNRLMINGDELQLYGESDTATSVIELLEKSDYFSEVQFRAPVTKNNATQKDRFQVSAKINHEGET